MSSLNPPLLFPLAITSSPLASLPLLAARGGPARAGALAEAGGIRLDAAPRNLCSNFLAPYGAGYRLVWRSWRWLLAKSRPDYEIGYLIAIMPP